jgi:Ca-activated chloride channel family protein
MNGVFGLTWAAPQFYWVAFPVFVALVFFVYRQYRVQKVVQLLGGKWQDLLILNFSSLKQYGKTALFSIGMLSIFLALLRPQWSKQDEVVAQEGRDVLIALDISKSMLAQDCEPNRLEYAKKKIRTLLQKLNSERVGLLLFSGGAFVQCPLTSDFGAFHMFLDHVDVESISSGTTALAAAVSEGIKLFGSSADTKNKVLLLCTDGEDFSSDLAAVKQQADQAGVRIFTLGFGTPEGAPIPHYTPKGKQEGHIKDRQGKVVISKRNDALLQSLAHDLGGIYVAATGDGSDCKRIVQQVEKIEKGYFEDKKVRRGIDYYQWFLFFGLMCLLGEWIL